MIAGQSEINVENLNLGFKKGSVGPKVSFKKENWTDPETHKDVIIEGVLEITRNFNQGIYNIAVESQYNGGVSPLNTEWNTQYVDANNTNWAPLWDISNRTYDDWRDAIETPEGDTVPPLYVGMKAIMHETTQDRYWLVEFTQWTPGGNGGGFAYDRWEIYPTVFFERPNYEDRTMDIISKDLWIGRNSNQGQIFNRKYENEAQVGQSPLNTRWNSEWTDSRAGYSGFGDLSNLEDRVYADFTYALDYSVGNNVVGAELIMHDMVSDLYYKVVFDSWQGGGNGGGFSYNRTVIPQNVTVKFGDGSVLNTASGSQSGNFPYVDIEGNTIIADSNNDTVNVGNGSSHLIPEFSGMLLVNDHNSGRVELWIAGGGTTQLVSNTEGVSTSTLVQNGNGYEWTNVDNLNGPFTFTVVKTRDTA